MKDILNTDGVDVLPVTIVDGEVVKTKTYPTDEEFCKFLEVSEDCLKSTIKIETKKCNCKGGCC